MSGKLCARAIGLMRQLDEVLDRGASADVARDLAPVMPAANHPRSPGDPTE